VPAAGYGLPRIYLLRRWTNKARVRHQIGSVSYEYLVLILRARSPWYPYP
jgi:hypothetical protein